MYQRIENDKYGMKEHFKIWCASTLVDDHDLGNYVYAGFNSPSLIMPHLSLLLSRFILDKIHGVTLIILYRLSPPQ
jgi:hypothetical protein